MQKTHTRHTAWLQCKQSIVYWPGNIWQAYDRYIHVICRHHSLQGHTCWPGWSPNHSLPRHLCTSLLIFTILATERQATRGWGRPKFHSQALTSYTWLPLRVSSPLAASAQPNGKPLPCRAAYLCGMVEVIWNPSNQDIAKRYIRVWTWYRRVCTCSWIHERVCTCMYMYINIHNCM